MLTKEVTLAATNEINAVMAQSMANPMDMNAIMQGAAQVHTYTHAQIYI